MRRFLRYSHWFTLLCGMLGILLMVWLRIGGPDEKGLYPDRHPAWTCLVLLTLAILAVLWLLSQKAGDSTSYRGNFPASIPAFVGYVLAGSGIAVASFSLLSGAQFLEMVTAVMGLMSSIALFYGGFCRFSGKKSPVSVHCLPCFYFALQVFYLGKVLGSETETCLYLFAFLSALTAIGACYWLWSFEVRMGNRANCLFWCLAAAYCNLVGSIGSSQWPVHICIALWLLSALPELKYSPKRLRPEAAEANAAGIQWPTPPADDVVAHAASHTPPVQDVDAILEQILREFGSDSNP